MYNLMHFTILNRYETVFFRVNLHSNFLKIFLQDAKEETETQFLLSDQVYMKSRIPPTDKVCLWLGVSYLL